MMIELRNVSKRFGTGNRSVEAVRDVSLSIDQGEIFGIIGFSGAGKSTLVRCINLLERPTAGQVFVAGQELTALPERRLRAARKKIGMIFQLFNLMKSRTVFSNVAYPLRGMGLTQAQKREKVMRLLQLVGLEEKERTYPSQLSGGQKQRVAIARALANDPDVLLCDEATSALDPQTTQDILKLLRELNQRLGITIVLITHEMAVVKEICTRVAVMEDGMVVEENAIYSIFADPKREITRKFIRSTSNLAHMEALLAGDEGKLGLRPGDWVARFECRGDSTGQALVSFLSRQYALDISIVFGNVEMLQGTPLGTLMVSFRGEQARIEQALEYLKQIDVGVEVIRRV